MYQDELRKFALVARIDLLRIDGSGAIEVLGGIADDNPAYSCEELRDRLLRGSDLCDHPFMMRDEFEVYWSCIRSGSDHLLIGPLSSVRQTSVSQRSFYRHYGLTSEDLRPLRTFSIQEILYIIELIARVLTGKSYEETELLFLNNIGKPRDKDIDKEFAVLMMKEDDQNEDLDNWRHTFREERKLLAAVREGRVEDASEYNRMMDNDAGRLSDNDYDHWKNLAIVGITLASRAAIEGGLSPQTVYQISGYYINRCNECTNSTDLIGMRDYAIRDMTERVRDKLSSTRGSSYTEACRNYITSHYREKIYLNDIAEALGVSPSYLSRLFHRETGTRIQDYITMVRVQKASNMLKYSDESISRIAEIVGFPSQSYMGKVFKKQLDMTPREYRDQFRVSG